jgi:cystathionine gamma-synthase
MRRFSTNSVHGHDFYDAVTGGFKVPIFQSVIFEHPDRKTGAARKGDRGFDLKYSREENPTVRALERLVSKLEEGKESLAFGSGMACISTLYLSALRNGDTVMIAKESYGVTQELALDLARFGVGTEFAGPETDDLISAIKPSHSIVFVEVMSNPLLRVLDAREISKRCTEVGTRLVVDGTFTTPFLYRPLKDSAWCSVHSTTKYLAGHNDSLGGVLCTNSETDIIELWAMRRKLGTIISPFEAFLTVRGISTLRARLEVQSNSAMRLANFLSDHPKVSEVFYPGLENSPYRKLADRLFLQKLYGGVLSFRVKGGAKSAINVLKRTKIIRPAASLGGVESLLSYPLLGPAQTMPLKMRRELGITDDLLRLSVGLEDAADLEDDLDKALRIS